MGDIVIWWSILNIILLGFFLYFVSQGLILISTEKEILSQDSTIYYGLGYICIYDIFYIFLLFAKIVYLVFLKIDNISYDSVKTRIETIEFFYFIPQLIEMFLLIAQISYYNGYRFSKKEEFLEIQDFKTYCLIKENFGISYCIWLLGCFLFFSCGLMCMGCNYCRCCLAEFGIFQNKSRQKYFSKRSRNNRIHAV